MPRYYRLSGAGNDFLALVEPAALPDAAEIRAWCRRGVSLGADGVLVLSRTSEGARMTYFNADGARSSLCLNGSRCAAQLAFHLGWATGELALDTDVGRLDARRLDEAATAVRLPPLAGVPESLVLPTAGGQHEGWKVSVGVPHFVLPWPAGIATAPVGSLGPLLRRHPHLGPAGANVDFVRFGPRHRLEIRSFERGVEAETLACGTGVVAAVAAGIACGRLGLPVTALTAGGFELSLDGELTAGRLGSCVVAGDARIVASGELLAGATSAPPPPQWG